MPLFPRYGAEDVVPATRFEVQVPVATGVVSTLRSRLDALGFSVTPEVVQNAVILHLRGPFGISLSQMVPQVGAIVAVVLLDLHGTMTATFTADIAEPGTMRVTLAPAAG